MAGYYGDSMSNNAVEEYAKGNKPFSRITKEDMLKYGVDESVSLFRWYVKTRCRTISWHHTSPEFNETNFYDVEACCEAFKKTNIEALKHDYKEYRQSKSAKTEQKKQKFKSESYYFAKIEYSTRYKRKYTYHEDYAVVCGIWAYLSISKKKKIDGSHFRIIEVYKTRPEKMVEETTNKIIEHLTSKNQGITLCV